MEQVISHFNEYFPLIKVVLIKGIIIYISAFIGFFIYRRIWKAKKRRERDARNKAQLEKFRKDEGRPIRFYTIEDYNIDIDGWF